MIFAIVDPNDQRDWGIAPMLKLILSRLGSGLDDETEIKALLSSVDTHYGLLPSLHVPAKDIKVIDAKEHLRVELMMKMGGLCSYLAEFISDAHSIRIIEQELKRTEKYTIVMGVTSYSELELLIGHCRGVEKLRTIGYEELDYDLPVSWRVSSNFIERWKSLNELVDVSIN